MRKYLKEKYRYYTDETSSLQLFFEDGYVISIDCAAVEINELELCDQLVLREGTCRFVVHNGTITVNFAKRCGFWKNLFYDDEHPNEQEKCLKTVMKKLHAGVRISYVSLDCEIGDDYKEYEGDISYTLNGDVLTLCFTENPAHGDADDDVQFIYLPDVKTEDVHNIKIAAYQDSVLLRKAEILEFKPIFAELLTANLVRKINGGYIVLQFEKPHRKATVQKILQNYREMQADLEDDVWFMLKRVENGKIVKECFDLAQIEISDCPKLGENALAMAFGKRAQQMLEQLR